MNISGANIPDILGVMVPIVAIVMGVGLAFWRVYWDHQRKRLEYEERRQMIERGLTPPPQPTDPLKYSPESSLRNGLLLAALGVGLFIAYGMGVRNQGVLVGAPVVLLIGVAYLIYYGIVKKQAPPSPPPSA